MKCGYSEKDIALFVEGDLEDAALRAVDSHLAICHSCRVLAEDLRESQIMLKDLRQEIVSPAAVVAVRHRVVRELDGVASQTAWGRTIERWLFLGARRGYALAGVAFVLAMCVSAAIVWRFGASNTLPSPAAVSPTRETRDLPEAVSAATIPAGIAAVAEKKAPVPVRAGDKRRSRQAVAETTAVEKPAGEPKEIVVKLLTDDPNIVIYWIVDQDGGSL